MNGPEHYREAERLANKAAYAEERHFNHAQSVSARAQVHATLALTAAIAGQPLIDAEDHFWGEVLR